MAPQRQRREARPNVYISYRRGDSAGSTGRLAEALRTHFGTDRVFMDVDTIRLGDDFQAAIENKLETCDVLIAVVGRSWLTAADERGLRRLDNPEDWVRIEIEAALNRDVPVVPVLVEKAEIPDAGELPDALRALARRNAIELRHEAWGRDVDKLVAGLKEIAHYEGAPSARTGEHRRQEMLAQVEFSRIAIANQSADWYEYEPPPKRRTYPFDRHTSQYVRLEGWVQGTDLPFDVTLINRSAGVVLVTHLGVELVAVTHLFDNPYKGEPPRAVKIKLEDAYEVEPHRGLWSPGDINPDEDTWLDIGDISWVRLDDPVYLPADAPYRFVLNIPQCDAGFLSDHAILRLAIRSGDAELTSPDITAFMHSWTEPLISIERTRSEDQRGDA
jgi:hypothetical protein